MFVKPGPGLKVRHPVTKTFISEDEGTEVPDGDFFWVRLLRDGDVVLTDPPSAPTTASRIPAPASASADVAQKPAADRSAE